jgi:hypothetical protein
MKYLKGYQVKPLKTENGHVTFTDGSAEIMPSQVSCEAYGYIWNKANSTCMIRGYESGVIQLNKKFTEVSNTMGGTRNKIGGFVSNSAVYGSNNRFEGGNKNIVINGNKNLVKSNVFDSAIISGSNNTIGSDVNNSTIISGVGATSIRDNETVIGGFYKGGLEDANGDAQSFTTQVTKFTMQTSLSASTILHDLFSANGEQFIRVQKNSFIIFRAECMITGNGIFKNSSGTLNANVSVGSNGTPLIVGSSFDFGNNSSSTYGDHLFYLSNTSSGLRLRTRGIASETVIIAAAVTLTEIIHDPSIVI